jgi:aspartyl-tRNA(Asn)/glutamyl-tRNA(Gln) amidotransferase subunit C
MTGMNEAQIKKLAHLARLALTDAEVRALVPELAGIVRHVDSLAAIDVAGVEPMTHGSPLAHGGNDGVDDGGARPARAGAADDEGAPILSRAAIAGSAGLLDDGSVRVPRVVD